MKSRDEDTEFEVELSVAEMAQVESYAQAHGLTTDEAASRLISERLQALLRRKTRRSPAKNVLEFRKTNTGKEQGTNGEIEEY